MKTILQLMLISQVFWASEVAWPQSANELGKPNVTVWLPKEYGAATQNWAIVQDDRGVMYFGNNSGVLEYDGISWRLIQLPNKNVCRSLARDASGRIYTGGVGDFGYLAPDSLGQMRFVSLLPQVPEEARDFADVWQTHFLRENVYFQTSNYVFRWTPSGSSLQGSEMAGEMKLWQPDNTFHLSFVVDDIFYVREWEKGLLRIEGDSLRLVPGGEQFANERIYVMLPFASAAMAQSDGSSILIGTRTQGLFLYDGQTFHPFKTEADDFLSQNPLYLPGTALSAGRLLLNSIGGGAVLLDRSGKLLQTIDRSSDLPDNSVFYVYSDPVRPETQWLGLNNGIARLEAAGPFSYFDADRGLESTVIKVQRHRGVLYAATGVGVFYLDAASMTFKPVNMPVAQAWIFLAIDGQLLAATGDGVYAVSGNKAAFVRQSVNRNFIAFALYRSRQDRQRVFVGLFDGLASLGRENGVWRDEGRAAGIQDEIRTLVETADGRLWAGTSASGVLRLTFSRQAGKIWQDLQVERFGPQHGLPEGGVGVYEISGTPYFSTSTAIYRFHIANQRFVADSTFMVVPSNAGWFMTEDDSGWVWVLGKELALGTPQADGSYRWLKAPFRRLSDEGIDNVYSEENGVVWFGGASGVIRYDATREVDYAVDYPALVRRVVVGEDSVIYGGATPRRGIQLNAPTRTALPYALNNLLFEYSASSYEDASRLQFQIWLEGFDEKWSNWNNKTEKEYTNLPAGDYQFRVRAKNVYDRVSQEGVYVLSILPPWYRTWWAYGSYAVIFGLLVFATDRVQRRRLLKKEREHARLREAELRAEAAEAQAKTAEAHAKTAEAEKRAVEAENERKKNVELLSEIGKEITASLEMDTIFKKLYEHVNHLADATIFGVGIYHEEKHEIEYRLAIEKGKRYAPYTRNTRDKNQFPVWCIENRQPVLINDVRKEFNRYIDQYQETGFKLKDGTISQEPVSLIYLPLLSQERVLGVITIQSFEKHAYTEYHLNILQNLATYTAIALDNADAYRQLNSTLENLKSTQQQLVTQQKLASLGALTAGIAHEIKNPLNFVNNFAELSVGLVEELKEGIEKYRKLLDSETVEHIDEILTDLAYNAREIKQAGSRADSVIQGMLLHSRGGSVERQDTDINVLLNQYLALAYHSMRAQDSAFEVTIEKQYDESIGKISVVPQDLGRVFLNILNNACYAILENTKKLQDGYSPTLSVSTKSLGNNIEIRVRDNGPGIPEAIKDKIFNPFFTTKPAGEGTGLGLSLSYDIIVKEHRGDIEVETEKGSFTEFIITLPKEST